LLRAVSERIIGENNWVRIIRSKMHILQGIVIFMPITPPPHEKQTSGPRSFGFRHCVAAVALATSCALCRWTVALSTDTTRFGAVLALWILACSLVCLAATFATPRRSFQSDDEVALYSRKEMLFLAVLLLLAAVVRAWSIEGFPYQLHNDEMNTIMEGQRFLHAEKPPLFSVGWWRQPNGGFLLASLGMRVFGDSLWGARMTSAMFSVFTLGICYSLWRRLFSILPAQLGAVMFVTTPLLVHFGRTAFQQSVCLFCISITLLLLVRAMRSISPGLFAVAGVATAVAWQTYTIVYMVAPVILVLSLRGFIDRTRRRATALGMVWFVCGFLVAAAPIIHRYIVAPDDFAFRARTVVSIFAPKNREHLKHAVGQDSIPALLAFQCKRVFAYPFIGGDASLEFGYNSAPFSAIAQVLMILGFVWCLAHLKMKEAQLALVWVVGTAVFGGVLAKDPPYSPRLVGILMFLLPIITLPMAGAVKSKFVARNRTLRRGIHLVVIVLLGFDAAYNIQGYFGSYADYSVRRLISRRDWVTRVAKKHPNISTIINCGDAENFNHEAYRFMVPGYKLLNQPECTPETLQSLTHESPALVFMHIDDPRFEPLKQWERVKTTQANISSNKLLSQRYLLIE
jgi:hypothetical protein